MPFLDLHNVSAGYGGHRVLRGASLSLEAGEIVTLIGANGAGKSTLVKSISGILRPLSGRIVFDGREMTNLSPADRLRNGIAHIPEGRQIFFSMTVSENLDLGAYLRSKREAADLNRYAEVWATFPILKDRMNDIAGNFSGGQQQMLAIARGLMSRPRLLLMDEPSLGIAPLLLAEIFQLILRLRDRGLTILLAEQNARQALAIADRGYVLENGEITMSGRSAELLSSSAISEKYLGVGAGADSHNAETADVTKRLHRAMLSADADV